MRQYKFIQVNLNKIILDNVNSHLLKILKLKVHLFGSLYICEPLYLNGALSLLCGLLIYWDFYQHGPLPLRDVIRYYDLTVGRGALEGGLRRLYQSEDEFKRR